MITLKFEEYEEKFFSGPNSKVDCSLIQTKNIEVAVRKKNGKKQFFIIFS